MTKPQREPISAAMTVVSPCTNVCRIDRRSGWCEGCRRTVDEITRWPRADDAERQAILDQLPTRVIRKRLGVSW
ncbi:DUF1289 domain-containing protein [Polymorphobacter fuscus]|nr:DUF1289 domain-containing protein [Polymorphobacter fuscus]NJC09223.1 hypothetical protein [Polymorphobacter fuscus]